MFGLTFLLFNFCFKRLKSDSTFGQKDYRENLFVKN